MLGQINCLKFKIVELKIIFPAGSIILSYRISSCQTPSVLFLIHRHDLGPVHTFRT